MSRWTAPFPCPAHRKREGRTAKPRRQPNPGDSSSPASSPSPGWTATASRDRPGLLQLRATFDGKDALAARRSRHLRRGGDHFARSSLSSTCAAWIWGPGREALYPHATHPHHLHLHARSTCIDRLANHLASSPPRPRRWLEERSAETRRRELMATHHPAARHRRSPGVKATELATKRGDFEPMLTLPTSTSAPCACSPAPATSKQAAKRIASSAPAFMHDTGPPPARPTHRPAHPHASAEGTNY